MSLQLYPDASRVSRFLSIVQPISGLGMPHSLLLLLLLRTAEQQEWQGLRRGSRLTETSYEEVIWPQQRDFWSHPEIFLEIPRAGEEEVEGSRNEALSTSLKRSQT